MYTFIVLADYNFLNLKILRRVRNKYCVLSVQKYSYWNTENYIKFSNMQGSAVVVA